MKQILIFLTVSFTILHFQFRTSYAKETRAEWVRKGCSASTYLMAKDVTCAQYKCMLQL